MGEDASGGAKAREELQLLDLFPVVDHEGQESEPDEAAAQGGGGAGAIVPLEAPAMAAPARADKMKTVLVDKARLCCALCSESLKRPIYQCAAGHLVCCSCRFKFRGNGCRRCRDCGVASAYTICPGLDVFFGGLQVPCPNEPYGCRSYTPYFKAADHERACAHAPCRCAEQGCRFAGSPLALLAHLAAAHAWPVHEIPGYGALHKLRVPAASVPDRLLVVEGDGERVFVLSVRARGAASAVSVGCVRASAEAGPQYRCELWAQAPAPRGTPGGAPRRLGMETDVACRAAPGKAAVEEGFWLDVVPEMMHGPEAAREMHLSVLIDLL